MPISKEEMHRRSNEAAVQSHKELVLKAIQRAANAREGTDAAIEQHYHDTRVKMGYQPLNGGWEYPNQDRIPVDTLPAYCLRDELSRLRAIDTLTQSDKARAYELLCRIEVIDNEKEETWDLLEQLI